jgi:hypothetical protein
LEDSAFSDEFCRFLQGSVASFEAAELLLFFARNRGADWSLPEALGRLRPAVSISDAEAARYLDAFRAAGLVSAAGERARYQPASYFLEKQVEALEQAYRERPVTLIRMIYALRDSRIQSFADAFKIRKG